MICQNAPPQACQKVGKKWILSNESVQKKIEKSAKMAWFSGAISIG